MEEFLKELEGLNAPPELLERLKRFQRPPVPHLDTISSRLALVRTFTSKLYDKAAEALPPPVPSLQDFVAAADVKPIIGYRQRWSIGERTRAECLDRWDTMRSDRAEWVARLAGLLNPRNQIEGLDRLQLLFLGDQHTARRELRSAFDKASSAHDIPRCAALVQSLSSVWKFADPESTALFDEVKAASQARNLFVTEFDQTRKYFPRPLDEELKQFARATDDRWIFHLWATGGMGKTTMLRRLISHEWVVGADRLPCAWLDLDYLDVATILQQPALLGLAMAAQWNEQLSQPVFGAFLSPSFKPLSALLFRTRGDGSAVGLSSEALDQSSRGQYRAGLSNPMRCGMLAGAVPPRTPQDRARLLSQTTALLSYWNDKLPDALATMSDGRPILLFLDTVEDASVHFAGQLLNLLTLLRTLRQQAQKRAKALGLRPVNLRLVISGRNHLGERDHLPEFTAAFTGECIERPLEGLEDPEAEAFLKQELTAERRVRMPEDLLAAMVDKSKGIPFNLSLFAEWASEDDALDADTVRRSEAVSAVMLIERTIKRIPYQPLRWIIRYGVVPRQLTREFLRDVMREPLLDALSGRAAASGADRPESRLEQDVWQLEPGFVFDADTLWNQYVLRYASDRNWIQAGEHPDFVNFRSDILQPMRRLLKKQAIFEQLHERARDWFAKGASGARFVDSTIESLYHRVELRTVPDREADDLLPALRDLLDAPALTLSHTLRVAACGALRGADFERLTAPEQAYVGYRLAEALAAQNDYSFATPAARDALAQALELEPDAERPAAPVSVFALLWFRAFERTSMSELLGALKAMPAEDQLRLSLLIAEVAPPRSPVAADVLRGAVATAQAIRNPAVPLGVIAERLARNLTDTKPDESIRYCQIAAGDYGARGETLKRSDMLRRASAIELDLGRLTRAEAALSPGTGDVELTPAVRLQLARIELYKGNPGLALDQLEKTKAARDTEQMEGLLLKAEALSQRMLVREAAAAWEEASKLASDQANTRVLGRVAVGQARLYRWWLRATDEGMPGSVLSMLQMAQSRRSGAAQRILDAPIADIEIWQIVCDRSNPNRWLRRAVGELGGESPMARIRLTLALSQVTSSLPPRRWNDLVEDAGLVPRSSRFTALTEPVLLGSPAAIEPRVRDAIAAAFEHEPEGVIEHAWYAVRYGELLAWLGFYERAVDLLASGVPVLDSAHFGQGWAAAVYRERRRVERRIRQWLTAAGRSPFPAPEPDPPDHWLHFWSHTPLRAAAGTIENAYTAVEAGQFALARACLLAAPELERLRLDTEFHAMARAVRQRTGLDGPPVAAASVAPPASLTPGPPDSARNRLGGPPFTVFEMRDQSGFLAVVMEDPPRQATISADSETVEILLRSRTIARRLVGRPLERMAADLAELLREAGLDIHGRRTFLKIPLSALCGAPWELAFVDAPLPVRLPSIWREAEVERQSQIERANEDIAIAGAPHVLLQPLSGQDKESPAVKAYLNLGSRFKRRLDDTSRAPARFVYVASSFIELPDVDEPALGGVSWTATTLSYTIETAVDEVKPAVILDVPLPAMSTDVTHQLLLRNLFAQLLLDSGRVSCVLATGLHPESEMAAMQARLLKALWDPTVSQIDLWSVVERFAREAKLRPHDAFFTANPYRPLAVKRFGVA